jgi:hypothetical protein
MPDKEIHTTKNWVLGLAAVIPWIVGVVRIIKWAFQL